LMRSWIQPPVIVDESGDTDVFETIEYAERYLEPIDVEEERYVAFDSAGRLLRLSATPQSVHIEAAEEIPNHAEVVHELLLKFLNDCGSDDPRLSSLSLGELARRSLAFATR
jgi:hypothetical protein